MAVGTAPGTITMSLNGHQSLRGAFNCLNGGCPPDPSGWYVTSPFDDAGVAPPAIPATASAGVTYKVYGTQSTLRGPDDLPSAPMRWDLVWKVSLGVLVAGLAIGYFASR